jgi:hypothetical protein
LRTRVGFGKTYPPTLPIAESHQIARHKAERPVVILNLSRQGGQNILERIGLGPHRDDRAGEALGFLAAGTAEHQPGEAHQRERPGQDRNPLRDSRTRQRLVGERAAG